MFVADASAAFVKEIIGELRTHTLPDSYDAIGENGERWVITTPGGTFDSVTYDKKIEIYTAGGEKYFEINYMKQEARGIVVGKPNVRNPTRLMTGVSIYFDGRAATKIMEVKVTAKKPEITIDGWLSHLHLYITKTDNIFTIEGGVQASDFVFNDDEWLASNTPIIENHTYMLKAKADEVANLAVAHLGFPLSSVTEKTDLYIDHSISNSFTELAYNWIVANSDVQTAVDTVLSPYSVTWDDNKDTFKTALDLYFIVNPGETDNEFYFLYGLDNPAGFDSNGYHSNGSSLDTKFNYLATGFTMDANISPADVAEITIDFGS